MAEDDGVLALVEPIIYAVFGLTNDDDTSIMPADVWDSLWVGDQQRWQKVLGEVWPRTDWLDLHRSLTENLGNEYAC